MDQRFDNRPRGPWRPLLRRAGQLLRDRRRVNAAQEARQLFALLVECLELGRQIRDERVFKWPLHGRLKTRERLVDDVNRPCAANRRR